MSASGDTALTVPGTEPRNRIDKLFSPESIKANLPTLVGKGMTESGMKYGRRVADRVGAVGMAVGLSNPKLVSISDDVGVEAAHAGGFKTGESTTDSRSVDVTAGLNTPMRPTKGAVGSTALGGTAKWTPWSKSKTTGADVTGGVDRNRVVPATGRTVLVQLDAQVTVVGESRASNTVRKGSTSRAGSVISLPGGVFVRVSEDVARDMGVLPSVESTAPPVEQGTMASPSTLLGLGLVEQAPDLSGLVPQLRDNLGKVGKNLLPKSVLDDSMNNLRRLTDLTSEASVKALVDSALDGGVPLLVHDPGVFGKDTYQVTLRAVPGTPVFEGAVNDGIDIEHTSTGTQVVTRTSGGGTGWGVGLKVPASGLLKTGDPNVSASVGGSVAANAGQAQSWSTTESTTRQVGHTRSASGPAARYTVPVTFELVVEKGSKEIGRASSGQVEMSVRVPADNQKTTASPPATSTPSSTTRPAEEGTPERVREWQGTALPPFASVENLRGAQLLQDAAVRALTGAGAGSGLIGKGTGAMNALRSGLALESLQPNLPGMLDGAFEVPGLHEASVTTSQHARLKVYAKLVNPRLEALSDGVAVSTTRSTTGAMSSEAKKTESHDVSVAVAPGGVTSKKPDLGFSAGGVEGRHASEDSAAVSGGTTHNPSAAFKTEGRTGLVSYDVEYRVVADLGKGRTGVVDLVVPGSAQVRMHAADAETALGRPLPDDLGAAQTSVHDAAKAWRAAEVAADEARHSAQTTINSLAPRLAEVTARADSLSTAERGVADAATRLETAQRQRSEAGEAVSRAQIAVDEAADLLRANELNAELASQLAVAAREQAVREHEDALATAARTAELVARARDLHSEVVIDLGTAQAHHAAAEGAVLAAEEDLRQAEAALDAARSAHDAVVRAEQDVRAEIAVVEAEVERTRAEAAEAQRAWWEAKAAVDQEVGRFNAAAPGVATVTPTAPTTAAPLTTAASQVAATSPTRPAPPDHGPRDSAPQVTEAPRGDKKVIDDESWRHSPAATAEWFAPSDPVSPEVWAERRAGAHVRTVDTEVADVTTDSTPSNVRSYQGLVRYDLRRIETSPGRFVQEYTVKVHLRSADPAVLEQVRTNAHDGVNSLLNKGFRLPGGDQFHVNLEFTDNPADAHTTIEVGDTGTDQTHWNPAASPAVLAHETVHYLGVPDEYRDQSRVFLAHEQRSGVHEDGMMSADVHEAAGLRPRHLWLIERTATSQVMVPDTRLDSHDAATASGSRPHDAVTKPTRPAPVLPSRALPPFFQDGAALGTVSTVEVNGGREITQAVNGLLPQRRGVTPRGVDQIAPALSQNFESFLGKGRTFQIKVGKDWFEAGVKATLGTGTDSVLAPKTKIDFAAVSGTATSQTGTIGTAGDVGGAVSVGMAVGAQGTVAGRAALARPVTSTTTGTSTTDQRMIRSGEAAFDAKVPVTYEVTLTDARGNRVGEPVVVAQDVSLRVPGDSLTPADPGLTEVPWTGTLEHPAPEAVTDLDSAKAFEDIARQLHPSVTKLGAPGRTALQEFLSPTSIRDNLGAALNGWVVSPDLSSPHGSRGGVVRMRAVPVSAELVGTTSSINLRLHETAAISTGVSAATKSGFDASVAVGGGASVKNEVGGSASVSAGYSARTTESSSAGTGASTRTGIQVKGDLGLYRTKVRLEFETPHGTTIGVDATAYLRAGVPEAGAANLPVPPGSAQSLATPTAEPKFPPPYLASAAAAGAVKVGAFAPAAEVQSQVEGALRGIAGFEKFLPSFADATSDPRRAGKNMQDLADQLANQRMLATELSPAALKSQMDSLLGAGVQVQLKRQGLATNDFVNVTVKARVANPVHLGQADARSVRGSASTGPKLDSATTTQKRWSVGVEAKVAVPASNKKTSATPTPSVGAKYSSTTATKTTAGPTVGTTRLTGGSPNAQLFEHDVTFDVEITKFSRNRAWVKRCGDRGLERER
ncbi:hypothetical protein [Lentzea aerocolonigenes]|uniref:hypothetical protein n=1 Tax=Lentzea aerocolonigenes TaxID=68170 RepID=UPI0004C3CE50|nr:hypothetical protein [Lentzea aerocolonigenes]